MSKAIFTIDGHEFTPTMIDEAVKVMGVKGPDERLLHYLDDVTGEWVEVSMYAKEVDDETTDNS